MESMEAESLRLLPSRHRRPLRFRFGGGKGMRLRQCVYRGGGSSAYQKAFAHLPPGPKTAAEFADWPLDVVRSLKQQRKGDQLNAGNIRLARAAEMLRHGLIVHTDYSGQLSPEVAWTIAVATLQHEGADLREELIVNWRAAERNKTCQRLINSARRPPEHLFPTLESKLPAALREELRALRPQKKARYEEKCKAYEDMREVLWRVKANVFNRKLKARCLMHDGCDCPIAWEDPPDLLPSERPLTVCIAGTQCTPWSSFGSRQGLADSNTESWWIWLAEMTEMGFDLTILENAPHKKPLEIFEREMGPAAIVVHVMVGPEARAQCVNNQCINIFHVVVTITVMM